MRETEPVRTVTLSDTREQAAITARRYGVLPTMIAATARCRALGDWRGACAAADVEVRVDLDAVRRRHGAEVAEQLLEDLRDLTPDLLRWHLPRHGHGTGGLIEGLLVPLAEYSAADAGRRTLTLAAATPRLALDAGERIVLTVLESGDRAGRFDDGDTATCALLARVRAKATDRHSLVRHRMFWNAVDAPHLARYRDVTPEDAEITRLQDAGATAEAWRAAGIELSTEALTRHQNRWLSALPVALPGILERIGEALPEEDNVVLRPGGGAIVLSHLHAVTRAPSARVVAGGDVRALVALPTLPTAAWARPVDVDLLRVGAIRAHELHPLVASALLDAPAPAAPEPEEWLYRAVPFIEGPCHNTAAIDALWIRCGSEKHRVARADGTWQPVDHPGHFERESFLARLGGPVNPCLQAARYLGTGRHVIELVMALIQHGRADDVRRLLREHADAEAVLDGVGLPGGGTVGAALAAIHDNHLRLRMLLAGAVRTGVANPSFRVHRPDLDRRRRARKGGPARTTR
jgi:hypothetical protein